MLLLFGLILFVVLIIVCIDIIPQLKTWILRIKIGRYTNKTQWNEAITKKTTEWLLHTPKIKVTDNTRLIILDILKGNYSKSTIQHWQEAALILGLSEYLRENDDSKIKNTIKKYLDRTFDNKGQWINKPIHVDGAILAYAVMKLPFMDTNQYRPAYDYIWHLIKEHIGNDGTVGYRKSMRNYRYVDTIGFVCPFLVAYGTRYKNDECVKIAIKQITEFEKHGMLEKNYIPCHAYEIDSTSPLGLFGWGRGLGWFAVGLIDAWNELPKNHKDEPLLKNIIVNFAKAVLNLQQEDGGWSWTVTRKETRLDSSTTATLSWYLLNASKIEAISVECILGTKKAIKFLASVTRRDGAIEFSQGDTKDIGVYSMEFGVLPFTQGFGNRTINLYNSLANIEKDYSSINEMDKAVL